MDKIPFSQRLGIQQSKSIDNDFPSSGRIALVYLLQDLVNRNYVRYNIDSPWQGNWKKWSIIIPELQRTGRQLANDDSFQDPLDLVGWLLEQMRWDQVYTFCERVYDRILISQGYLDEDIDRWIEGDSIEDIKQFYTEELNSILAEENLAYQFEGGLFERRGRAQTQKSFQRVGAVLSHPALLDVRNHYNKARRFFNERPKPDVENCIKEALCALEACLEILTKKPASKDFTKVVKQIQGNRLDQIPSPVAEGMIKLHAYRGSGQGVAHAALAGTKVSELEAELILSLVASYITYLTDLLLQPEDEIPF